MARVAIYTDVEGNGFKALAPGWSLRQEFGWTREEAIDRLVQRLIEEARRLRQLNKQLPRSIEELPPGTRGELTFISV